MQFSLKFYFTLNIIISSKIDQRTAWNSYVFIQAFPCIWVHPLLYIY